jgi:hypothetical protein
MPITDTLPRPRVGRPVRHRFALPHRLVRGIPPTVLHRRRMKEALEQDSRPSFASALEREANRIAEVIRERLRDLARGLRRFQEFGSTWRRP